MHGYRAGQGASRARVLYVFRTPPNMRVGRKSMDAEVREALEHTHPDLTFDWDGLLREPMPPRQDTRERGPRQRPQGRKEKPGREPAVVSLPPPVADDETLLGRTVGASEAARLRARHAELSHRIARRARTPEERDRLSELAQRLNPDVWADETAIRAGMADFEARCEAIAAELPRRRRGRRGGKNRDAAPGQEPAADVIIGRRDDSNEIDAESDEGPDDRDPLDLDIPDADPGDDHDRHGDADTAPGDETATADPGSDPETDVR
jgi:hypothetical protein